MGSSAPLRFPTFRIVLSLGNAAVWGLILFGIGALVASQFHQDGIVARSVVLVTVAATALVAGILAVQGAVVNLEHQLLHGRFTYAPATADSRSPRNVWRVAVSASLLLCAAWVPFWLMIGGLVLGQGLSSGRTRLLIGGLGFVAVALTVYLFAPLELRRRAGAVASATRAVAVGPYLRWQYALPWGVVNGTLGGVLAWLSSPAHRDPTVQRLPQAQLAFDLALSTFLICVFMGVVTMGQAEVDVARGRVLVDRRFAPMPRLWLRFLYAALAAVTVWLSWSLFAGVGGLPAISLPVSFGVKTLLGGIVGAVAAWRCAAWSVARAAAQRATSLGEAEPPSV
jgi:hypothetical protein